MISSSVWPIEYTQTNHVHLCNITKTPFPSSKKPPDSKTWLHNRGEQMKQEGDSVVHFEIFHEIYSENALC